MWEKKKQQKVNEARPKNVITRKKKKKARTVRKPRACVNMYIIC